ncbi:MAG: PPC domain-containing DNA-binding protein [Acidobacteriota bacterium]
MKKLSIILAACLSATLCQPAFAQTKKTQPQKAKWEEASTNRIKTYVLRLVPGQDLRAELEQFTKSKNIRAGFIVTCVGSLRKAALRLADKSDATDFGGKFEIVSLVGTLAPDGPHLHISISDGEGKTIGGHLVAGCEIYTTAEIVIGDALGLKMTREPDRKSGYKELKIRSNTLTKKR